MSEKMYEIVVKPKSILSGGVYCKKVSEFWLQYALMALDDDDSVERYFYRVI